jgi:hypothetical protein
VTIPEFDDPRSLCFYIANIGAYVSMRGAELEDDPTAREELVDEINNTRHKPLGTAIQEGTGIDLGPHREALDRIPDELRQALADTLIIAIRAQLQLNVELLYSTDGRIGTEITTWYRGPQSLPDFPVPEQPPSCTIRMVCPPLRPPVPDPQP